MESIQKVPGDHSNVPAGSRITDPFAVITEKLNTPPAKAARAAHVPQDQPPKANGINASKGGSKRISPSSPSSPDAAANLATKRRGLPPTDDAAARIGLEFGSPVDTDAHARNQLTMPQRVNLHEAGLRRSPRLQELEAKKSHNKAHVTWATKATRVMSLFTLYSLVTDVKIDMPVYNISPTSTLAECAACCLHKVNELYDSTLNSSICAYAYSTIALDMTNNEVFTYTKAMQQPDVPHFIEAMDKEIDDHQSQGHWDIVKRSTIPPGTKTIQAIWSFKWKRYPDGTLNKHKAQLCAHGDMQQWGVSFWETYSLVVNMLTVCFLLALCNIHGLESKSIDFILAFPRADLNVDIWMELPTGIVISGKDNESRAYVLKLKKSLYGLKQASLNWFEKLKQGLMDEVSPLWKSIPVCTSRRTWPPYLCR